MISIANRLILVFTSALLAGFMPVYSQMLPGHELIQTETSVTEADEIILKQTFNVNAPISEVWAYYTESEKYSEWAASVAEIELKMNGIIRANYRPDGRLSDDDTIVIRIVNYIPEKLLTLQPEIPESFPLFMREISGNFYNVIEFRSSDDNQTEITSYGLGYQNSPDFHQMLSFIAHGNIEAYERLIGIFN
jgi:hypothetical protein